MSFFPEAPAVRVQRDGITFVTTEPVHYSGKVDGWVIPEGFSTDFASIPAVVEWAIPKLGAYTLAAIVHDYFCSVGIREGLISGRDTDAVFRRIMRELETDFVTRWMVWTGVRWGALFNPIRRKDWWKDAPKVLVISVALLPVLLLPAPLGRPILRAASAVARLLGLR